MPGVVPHVLVYFKCALRTAHAKTVALDSVTSGASRDRPAAFYSTDVVAMSSPHKKLGKVPMSALSHLYGLFTALAFLGLASKL
jgi:hypothetical protein